MFEWLGWTATAVFTGSYFCTRAASLRRVQMLGAMLWIVYGLMVHARPVVAANVLADLRGLAFILDLTLAIVDSEVLPPVPSAVEMESLPRKSR